VEPSLVSSQAYDGRGVGHGGSGNREHMNKVFGRGAPSIPRQEESLDQDHAPMGKKHSWKVVRSEWEPVLHGSQDPGKLILRQGTLFANLERNGNLAGWGGSATPRDNEPRVRQQNSGKHRMRMTRQQRSKEALFGTRRQMSRDRWQLEGSLRNYVG